MPQHIIATPQVRPLLLGVHPRPRPMVAPVTLTWTDTHLVGLLHPGINAEEIAYGILAACPDLVAQQWIEHFGLQAPIARVRQRLEEYLPHMAHLDARWEHLPSHARISV